MSISSDVDELECCECIIYAPSKEVALETLREIKEVNVSTPNRRFENKWEYEAFVQRVRDKKAFARIKKVFLCNPKNYQFNVCQEIWFRDDNNPEVGGPGDPKNLKEYAVLHVHHHSTRDCVDDCQPDAFKLVDDANIRHSADWGALTKTQKRYSESSPVEDSQPEESGGKGGRSTYKIYPTTRTSRYAKAGRIRLGRANAKQRSPAVAVGG